MRDWNYQIPADCRWSGPLLILMAAGLIVALLSRLILLLLP